MKDIFNVATYKFIKKVVLILKQTSKQKNEVVSSKKYAKSTKGKVKCN